MRRHLAEVAMLGATTVVSVLGTVSEYVESSQPVPPLAGALALSLLAILTLPWRRRAPLTVAVAILVICLVYNVIGYSGLAVAIAVYPACYTLVSEGSSRRSLVIGVAVALGVLVISILPPLPPNGINLDAIGGIAFSLAAVVALAEAKRARMVAADEQLRRITQESERRLVDERLTIARELHDVLAHTITVINVQAAAALDALPARPEQTESALRTIRGAARDAMAELHSTLRVLRDSRAAESSAPQPRLDQVRHLVEPARGAGVQVDLVTTGAVDDVPSGVGLAAYRIIQEALTNVIRHANATTATVRITRQRDDLLVEVVDNGTAIPDGHATGHGMIGMRERVRAVGGTFEAGPAPGGGFAVTARLTLGAD